MNSLAFLSCGPSGVAAGVGGLRPDIEGAGSTGAFRCGGLAAAAGVGGLRPDVEGVGSTGAFCCGGLAAAAGGVGSACGGSAAGGVVGGDSDLGVASGSDGRWFSGAPSSAIFQHWGRVSLEILDWMLH